MRMWSCRRPQRIVHHQQWRYGILKVQRLHSATTPARQGHRERKQNDAVVPSSQTEEARHVLRSILRECTYLPDAQSRKWVAQHTLARFRKYEYKAWKANEKAWLDERLRGRLKEARQAFALLRRANEGERKCLSKVLFWTYGRTGKRRHELMEPLLPVKGRDETEKLIRSDNEKGVGEGLEIAQTMSGMEIEQGKSDLVKGSFATTIKSTFTPDLTPQLHALLASQIKASPPDLTRPNPRRLTPDIPVLNSWQRPMPQKRVKNMQKKHYAHLLDRVLPPLPTEEWERLRDLASGARKVQCAPPRRRISTGTDVLEMVVRFGKVPEKVFENRDAHAITPRYMQRLYAQIFSQCPRMDWDVEESRWNVTWGENALYAIPSDTAPRDVSPAADELHEGQHAREQLLAG